MTALTVPATDFARGLSDFLNQVQYRGQVLDISRGKKVIARVVPVSYPEGFPISQLDTFLAGLPSMTQEERESFAEDVASVRKRFNTPVRNAWLDE